MAGESKACRILTCREVREAGNPGTLFCHAHRVLWAKSGENRRAVAAGDEATHNRALMDFINRIDAEDRSGTTTGQ